MQKITITAPARLHLGFVELNGNVASEFGALGVAIERPAVTVKAEKASEWTVSGPMQGKVRRYVDKLIAEFDLEQPLHIDITRTIPAHIGLGSGTQLALAVGTACVRLNDTCIATSRLSHLLRRGGRSGIGTAAFTHGGFLVDREASTKDEARIIARRLEFPESWCILLVIDTGNQGAHGDFESDAFRKLGGFSESLADKLQRTLLEQVLPALECRDLVGFGAGITTIQNYVGDFFSPFQGGRFLSSEVAEVLEEAEKSGATGIGQSSWGPTGFVILENEKSAVELRSRVLESRSDRSIRLEICKARNEGAQIQIE